ncbi:MAG: DUF456 domain-containing protein [Nitrospirota bacterium]|nr:DUF456 domain-containing protein [Nitrospirota bacterium]
MIDTLLIILGGICMTAGIIGSVAPFVPGPPVSYLGLLLLQLGAIRPFSTRFLLVYAVLTILVVVLDSIIPVYGTKRFRGSSYGVWGSALGLLAGLLLFTPLGIIIGPISGAFLGELLSGKRVPQAFRSAFGSFVGFLAGTSIKVVLSLMMAYHFISAIT